MSVASKRENAIAALPSNIPQFERVSPYLRILALEVLLLSHAPFVMSSEVETSLTILPF